MRASWFVLVLTLQPITYGQVRKPSSGLDGQVRAKLAGFPAKVSLYARNLDTGAEYALNADERVRTASTIKLAIMVQAFAAVAEGKAKWTEELVLSPEEKVSGSGVLTEFSDNIKLPLRDLVHLMIVVSDNTATNLVLERFPADTVNARMEALGFKQTHSLRKVLGGGKNPNPRGVSEAGKVADNQRFGLGVSTPREMTMLMEKLYRGQIVSRAASDEMIAILKRQQYHDGIGRTLRDTVIASKSGALDHLRSDVAIVYTAKGAIAMAITVDDLPEIDYTSDNQGNLMISALSKLLLDGLSQ